MSETKGYRQLIVWQKSMDLIPEVYKVLESFPATERFGLSDQIRRAAVSIAANIAEGQGRNSRGEFVYFLGVSRGSLSELDTLLEISQRLDYLEKDRAEDFSFKIIEIRKLLFGLARKAKGQRE